MKKQVDSGLKTLNRLPHKNIARQQDSGGSGL